MDFRSKSERSRDAQTARSVQADYKREFERVRNENAQLHEKLDAITKNHGELQAQFNDLISQFKGLRAENTERAEDSLKIAKNMEAMVQEAYQKQGDLMDRFRADLSKRLSDARQSVNLEDEG